MSCKMPRNEEAKVFFTLTPLATMLGCNAAIIWGGGGGITFVLMWIPLNGNEACRPRDS